MIMLTSQQEGIVYVNGAYLGEIRKDAPVFRPIPPSGAVHLEFKPFHPMSLSSNAKLVFSGGKPLAQSVPDESAVDVVAWPFGITEVAFHENRIHTAAPLIKTLTGAGRIFKYIKTPAAACLETEFQGRISMHALPPGANEPVFAEGEGVLFVSGSTENGMRFALILTQSGEHLLKELSGKEITFLPGGKIRVVRRIGDLAGHETEEIYARNDVAYERESVLVMKNPDIGFRAGTPLECAVCAAETILFHLEEELENYVLPSFRLDDETRSLIQSASCVRPIRFTPPDGRSAIAVLRKITSRLSEGAPVFYKADMADGVWKIIDMKAW